MDTKVDPKSGVFLEREPVILRVTLVHTLVIINSKAISQEGVEYVLVIFRGVIPLMSTPQGFLTSVKELMDGADGDVRQHRNPSRLKPKTRDVTWTGAIACVMSSSQPVALKGEPVVLRI